MKITNPETAEYLSLNMPFWYNRFLQSSTTRQFKSNVNNLYDTDGSFMSLLRCHCCIIGELHNMSNEYTNRRSGSYCNTCSVFSSGDDNSDIFCSTEAEYNERFDEIVKHMKECHPELEIKIPIEVKA